MHVSNMSDSDCEAKRRQEFEKLAFGHMDVLYNTALRLTRNPLDAEDLVQEAFLRAYRFFHRFKPGRNFRAWIFKIMTNTFINQYRKRNKEPLRVEFDKVSMTYVPESEEERSSKSLAQGFEVDFDALFDDEVVAALEQLPLEFKTIVVLADIQSFSYKEIAEIVGCPIGTVMSRLSRGRKRLQNLLMEYALENGAITRSAGDN